MPFDTHEYLLNQSHFQFTGFECFRNIVALMTQRFKKGVAVSYGHKS
jgi:hypothetical protein